MKNKTHRTQIASVLRLLADAVESGKNPTGLTVMNQSEDGYRIDHVEDFDAAHHGNLSILIDYLDAVEGEPTYYCLTHSCCDGSAPDCVEDYEPSVGYELAEVL